MANQQNTALTAAFEILLEEIENVIKEVYESGSNAFSTGNLELARQMLEKSQKLKDYKSRVAALREDWHKLHQTLDEGSHRVIPRINSGRLKRGERTREEFYYVPILWVLQDMGGQGRVPDVLNRVYLIVKDFLTSWDELPLESDPNMPRWRNAAQWARNSMKERGLLKPDSPRGVWEISKAGLEYLQRHTRDV